MKKTRIVEWLCIAALLIASLGVSQPVQAGVNDPPPDHPGPYKAGFTFKLLYDTVRTSPNTPEGGRPVPCYVFYPAAPGNGDPLPPAMYPYDPLGFYGGLEPDPSTAYEAYGQDPAYQEVTPAQDGPFPLLIFSVGLGGAAESFYHLGARLASYGFVVVVITNFGDGALGEPTLQDYWYEWTIIDRELDFKFAITSFLEINEDPTNLLFHMIHPDQIAVSGHSWGGAAALGVVSGDPWFCEEGYEFPYPCLYVEPDPRIKATVPLDGSSFVFRYVTMANIKIPHMTINREWNAIVMENPEMDPSYFARQHAAIQGQPNYRVDISETNHGSFANFCVQWFYAYEIGWVDEETFNLYYPYNCYISPEHSLMVQDIVTMYMIAFLKANVAGDHSYQHILTPGYALTEQPLVEFFVTEKATGKEVTENWPDYFFYFMHQPAKDRAKALKDPPRPAMEPDFLIPIR